MIFIFLESLEPQAHFGTNSSRIHLVFAELEIVPRKWLYNLNFYCIAICDSLNINIKPFFCSTNIHSRNPGQSLTLITMGSK